MAKKLTLTHDDDAFFDKAIDALASTAELPDDASYDDKVAAAESELRQLLRMAIKNSEVQKIRDSQRVSRKTSEAEIDEALNQQAANLTIEIETTA